MTEIELRKLIPSFLLHSEVYSVVITDLEGRYIFTNEVFKKRFAFLTGDFIGKPFEITIHPEDVEKCSQVAYQCITNPDKTFQVQVRKPSTNNGDYYWTSWEFSLFKDQNQNPIGIFCLGHDITPQRVAQEKLKESEYKLRAILDSTLDSNVLISTNGKILNFNKRASELAQKYFNKEIKLGDDFRNYLLPKSIETFEYNFAKALNGERSTFEVQREFNQEKEWFKVSYEPVYADGQLLGVSINTRNIDDYKKAEEKLRQSEIMLRALYDSSNEALTLINSDYKILYNNRLAKEIAKNIFGKEPQVGDYCLDYYIPEVREEFANYYQRVLQGETISIEKEHQGIWWRFSLYPVYDTENKIFAIATNFKNITRRKLQDLALQEIQQKLDKTIEAIPHPLLIVDAETMQITYVNAEFEKVFGYAEQEVLGKTTDFLLPARYREKHRFLQQGYLQKGGLIRNMGRYLPALTKNDTEINIDASLNTFVANGKKYVILILQDVTEQKKQQDKILEQNKALQEISWQQSHEVRRPVANILGLCNLLQNYKDEPEEVKDKYVECMLKATQELDDIIHKVVEKINKI